jgi:hypothetical protein
VLGGDDLRVPKPLRDLGQRASLLVVTIATLSPPFVPFRAAEDKTKVEETFTSTSASGMRRAGEICTGLLRESGSARQSARLGGGHLHCPNVSPSSARTLPWVRLDEVLGFDPLHARTVT